MARKPTRITAARWNALYPVGTAVAYHPDIRGLEHYVTRTRSKAFVLPSGKAVVQLRDLAGCASLASLDIVATRGRPTPEDVAGDVEAPTGGAS